MVLLDRVLSVDEERLCAEVAIRPDSLFSVDGGVGAWVGLEYMAQAIAAYGGYGSRSRGEPVKIGFLLGARRYECARPRFAVGSVLTVSVRILHSHNGLASFECCIDDNDGRAATANVTVFQPAGIDDLPEGARND
jgi:predicted hotdog family 3-hydroxylacyl-ACP dehydratase